jgi:hypothetical protein
MKPDIETVRKAVIKGRLEDMGFRIPIEIRKYMDISPKGELVEIAPIPAELQSLANEVKETWRQIHDKEDLTEYRGGNNNE